MASDYSPPRLVKPTPGGAAGDGSLNGTLTVLANAETLNSTNLLKVGPSGIVVLHIDNNSNVYFQSLDGNISVVSSSGGKVGLNHGIDYYNGFNVQGQGLSPIYGLGQRVTVAATTSPGTTIATFTPGATGSCKVHVTIKNKDTVSVTANVLVSYTDPDVGAQTVLIINGVSIGASGIASATFVLDSTATAITVSAYGSVADELVCTADIEQFA